MACYNLNAINACQPHTASRITKATDDLTYHSVIQGPWHHMESFVRRCGWRVRDRSHSFRSLEDLSSRVKELGENRCTMSMNCLSDLSVSVDTMVLRRHKQVGRVPCRLMDARDLKHD